MKENTGSSSFLRIGDTVINTNYITTIKISSDNYHINMMGNTVGSFFGNFLFSAGSLNKDNGGILVEKGKYREGYDRVTRWLSDNNVDK